MIWEEAWGFLRVDKDFKHPSLTTEAVEGSFQTLGFGLIFKLLAKGFMFGINCEALRPPREMVEVYLETSRAGHPNCLL